MLQGNNAIERRADRSGGAAKPPEAPTRKSRAEMQKRWFLVLLPALAVAGLAGCSDEDTIDAGSSLTEDPINREAILGNLDDVRSLVEQNASGMDPMTIGDVDYADGELKVVLAESQDGLDSAGLQSACDSISRSVSLPDLTVVVEKANGSDSVECDLAA
jgi:hypothetical protein